MHKYTDNTTHTSSSYNGLFVATVVLKHRAKLLAWDGKQAEKERETDRLDFLRSHEHSSHYLNNTTVI